MSLPISTLTGANTIAQLIYNVNQIKTLAANTASTVANSTFQSALANTNSYIATKVNTTTFQSTLANTNSYIATKVNTTTFNSALANTNAYIATKVNKTGDTMTGSLTVDTNLTISGNSLFTSLVTTETAGEHAEENDANATGTITIQATDPTVLRRTLTGDVTLHVAGAPTSGYVSPNQLTYSADLQSTAEAGETRPWADDSTSLTQNAAVGPDGRTVLQKVIADASSATHSRALTITGLSPNQTLTVSAEVRDAGDSLNIGVYLYDADATSNFIVAVINPATGATVIAASNGGNATGATLTVTALSNSCYRLDVTGQPNTSGTNTQVVIRLFSGTDAVFLGDASGGVYIGNVQVNTGQPVGMIENGAIRQAYGYGWSTELRTTQDGTGGRDLTILPANLLTYSEQFDNAAWTKSQATVSADAATAPDGRTTADKLIEDSTTNGHSVLLTISKATSAITYTGDVFCKAAERTQAYFWLHGAGGGDRGQAVFDLSAGTVLSSSAIGAFTGITATIEDAGDGWWRIRMTVTSDTSASITFNVGAAAGGSFYYLGDGASGIYVWGAQLVAASTSLGYGKVGATRTGMVSWNPSVLDFTLQAAGVTSNLKLDIGSDGEIKVNHDATLQFASTGKAIAMAIVFG
jgi:hypothetical protein